MIDTFLAAVPLFASLKRKDLQIFADFLNQIELPPGAILFREGEQGDSLYVVVHGEVEVVKSMGTHEERLLRVLKPRDYFGEMSFFNPKRVRSASVRTRTPALLVQIERDTFDTVLLRRPTIALVFARELTHRLCEAEENLVRILREKDENQQSPSTEPRSSRDAPETNPGGVVPSTGIPILYIHTLGGFRIFRGESPIDDAAWQGKQPKLLLKAIVSHGPGGVPKDVVFEDLWPDGDPDLVEKKLKVVLHRLRRTLEPEKMQEKSSSYINLRAGVFSIDEQLCRTDVGEFLSLCERARNREEQEDRAGAVFFYMRAIRLYRGDFLPEDLYAPWAELRRTELRTEYIALLCRMAELHEARGALKKAADFYQKVLDSDPTLEAVYQKLMSIYSSRGMRSEAIKTYEDCCKALREQLDADPDPLTTSIYRKLLG